MMRVYIICLLAGLIIVGLAGVGWAWFEWERGQRKERAASLVERVLFLGGVELIAFSASVLTGVLGRSVNFVLYGLLGIGLLSLLYVQIRRYRDAAREPTMKNYAWFTSQGALLTSLSLTSFLLLSEHVRLYVLQIDNAFRFVYAGIFALMLVIVGLIHNGVGLILWEVGQRRRERGGLCRL